MKNSFILSAIITLFIGVLTACTDTAQTETTKNSNVRVHTNTAIEEAAVTTDAAKAFSIDFKTEPGEIQAGTPANLVFMVKDKTGATVKDLQIVHEKPMHLLVVSKDLGEFYHIHPDVQPDGTYRVQHVFPNGGDYRLYADFTPKDSTQVVEQINVKVAGTQRESVELVTDQKLEKTVDGLRMVMKPDSEIKAGQELMLDFQAFDAASGKPATDLENYLGELAHFVIISQDMKDFVHAHPMSKSEHGKTEKGEHKNDGHSHGQTEALTKKESASEVSAHVAFPRSGLYKIWAQFQRRGKVITVPFVVKAGEGAATSENSQNVPADAIKVTVSGSGYQPGEVKVKKGQPVKLAFYRASADNCGGTVVFPKLNIKKTLPVGETVLVELTPGESGEFTFTCGMGMYKGALIVN